LTKPIINIASAAVAKRSEGITIYEGKALRWRGI
jgi:hypothetical protein